MSINLQFIRKYLFIFSYADIKITEKKIVKLKNIKATKISRIKWGKLNDCENEWETLLNSFAGEEKIIIFKKYNQ